MVRLHWGNAHDRRKMKSKDWRLGSATWRPRGALQEQSGGVVLGRGEGQDHRACAGIQNESSSEQAQEMVCKDLSHSSEGMRGREGGKQPHIGGYLAWGSRSQKS